MQRLWYYFKIYGQILKMTGSIMASYRFNMVIQGLFMIVFIAGQYLILQAMFLKTPVVGGWSKDEVLLLFSVFVFTWGCTEFFFFDALRRFTYIGVRLGDADRFLTKPLSAQLMISMGSPVPAVIPQQIVAFILFTLQFQKLAHLITPWSIFLFLFFSVISLIITYLVDATYATLAFHVDQSTEALRLVQTLSDTAQYPLSVYPKAIQPFLFSVIPLAYMSYLQTSFLLQKGSWGFAALAFSVLIIMFVVNRFAWHIGWKKYTSASS